MGKIFTAIGLMSGTSMDGVDLSIIRSDGEFEYIHILDRYFEYDEKLHKKLVNLRGQIFTQKDLIKSSEELKILEREITIFHSQIIKEITSKYKDRIDLIGFHGQTIFHDSGNKISKQLGDGELLSQLTRKTVVYDFRKNDLNNGGQGAPLTPIFHNLISNKIFNKKKIECPNFLNIGGISNITNTVKNEDGSKKNLEAFDIGPGNCLIDEWIRKNTNERFDKDGLIGKSGNINQIILNQAIENFNFISYNKSLDIKDFDISFARGLSIKDGCATITNFTAYLISEGIKFSQNRNNNTSSKYLVCGGGRKNIHLIESIKQYVRNNHQISIDLIDQFNYDGDFIESQAFGYLAIRSFLKLPITFPSTTGCCSPLSGGIVTENF
tara:strand:+ start:35 stop:1180 length:1146 start_codon:yes stop_codon:yes gene_type:complete